MGSNDQIDLMDRSDKKRIASFFKYFFLIEGLSIKDLEKLILLRVLYFDLFGDFGYFIETNASLCKVFGKTIATVSIAVNSLERQGMIEVDRTKGNISRRIISFNYTFFKPEVGYERKLSGQSDVTFKKTIRSSNIFEDDLQEIFHQNILIENKNNININKQSDMKENFHIDPANSSSFSFNNNQDHPEDSKKGKRNSPNKSLKDFKELLTDSSQNVNNVIPVEGKLIHLKEVKNKFGKGNFCNIILEDIKGDKLHVQINEMLYTKYQKELEDSINKAIFINGSLFYNKHLRKNSMRAKHIEFKGRFD